MSRRFHAHSREREWSAACHDARYLAVELAAGRPSRPIDVMSIGLVLEPGETAFRHVPAEISQYRRDDSTWPMPVPVTALVTDRRVLVRLGGSVISLWWNGLAGVDLNWTTGSVVLDYGDGTPRALSGPYVADLAVAVAVGAYGVEALLTHRAFEPLRQGAGLSAGVAW